MKIANFEIGTEPFLIAEAGLNHNGDLNRALEMVRVAKACGVHAVKFQTFKADGVCDAEQDYTYHSNGKTITEKRIEIFRRCELPDHAWPLIKAECDREGVIFLSTPQNPSDLDLLLKVGIPAIKIGSDDLTNIPMLEYCAKAALPILLSCGMSTMNEVATALSTVGISPIGTAGNTNWERAAVLVCTSEYPCPPASVNIMRIRRLQEWFNIHIGFSDHTQGALAAGIAVGLGARIFECHFTLDHLLEGPDQWWSKTPVELNDWAICIRQAHQMLGDGVVKPTAAELENKAKYQRTMPA